MSAWVSNALPFMAIRRMALVNLRDPVATEHTVKPGGCLFVNDRRIDSIDTAAIGHPD